MDARVKPGHDGIFVVPAFAGRLAEGAAQSSTSAPFPVANLAILCHKPIFAARLI